MPHRHPLAMGLYLASWLILINAFADFTAATFPATPVRAFKQAVTD